MIVVSKCQNHILDSKMIQFRDLQLIKPALTLNAESIIISGFLDKF